MTVSPGRHCRRALPAALLSLVMSEAAAAAAGAPEAGGNRIDVDRLASLSVDTVGALTQAEGGLPADLWKNTPRPLVDALLPRLPVATASPAMRALMVRLLLSAGPPPQGEAETGTFVAERAWLLWRMGERDALLRLVGAVPAEARSPPLLRLEADARLLAGDIATACRSAESRVSRAPDVFWQKLLGFCQAQRREADKAQFTVALLAERGEDVRSYATLIAALGGGSGASAPSKFANPTPLDLAMLRSAGLSPAPEAASAEDLPVLTMIAASDEFAQPLRLAAAERAVAAGVLPADRLYPLYRDAVPAKPASTTARSGKPEPPQPAAVLLRAALAANTSATRLGAAVQVLEAGRREGRWLAAAHTVAPFLAQAEPAPELAGYAQSLVPALIVLGERGLAGAWIAWLSQRAKTAPVADAALTALLPLARLARLEQAHDWSPDTLFEWWEAERNRQGGRLRAARLFALLSAAGETVPEALGRALLDGPAQQTTTTTIDPAFSQELGRSAGARRTGETVVVAMVALGTPGPEAIDTSGGERIVESLRAAGLEADARALAVELVAAAQ